MFPPPPACTFCGWYCCSWACLRLDRQKKVSTSVTPVGGPALSLSETRTFTCAEGTACEGAALSTRRVGAAQWARRGLAGGTGCVWGAAVLSQNRPRAQVALAGTRRPWEGCCMSWRGRHSLSRRASTFSPCTPRSQGPGGSVAAAPLPGSRARGVSTPGHTFLLCGPRSDVA